MHYVIAYFIGLAEGLGIVTTLTAVGACVYAVMWWKEQDGDEL